MSIDLSEIALDLEARAERYRERGFPELADKVAEGARLALDIEFQDLDPINVQAVAERIQEINAWLKDYDRRLDENPYDAT